MLVLIDANARPPHTAANHALFGNVVNPTVSSTTSLFQRCCEQHTLAVPATFSVNLINDEPALTYSWHPDHRMISIDHILTSHDIIHMPQTYFSRYIEAQKDSIDHFALFGTIQVPAILGDRHVHRISPCYGRILVRDASKRRDFCQLLKIVPTITYDVEPTTHSWALSNILQSCAKQAFADPLPEPYNKNMPDQIFAMVLQRSRISRIYFRATKFLRLADLRAGFYVWANRSSRVKWSNSRGFKSKFLCLQQFLSHQMRRFMMTRNHAYMEMHRMMEMEDHADNVADVFFIY